MKFETIAERLNSNDRAVSPVIGVILMVAITVILAAVIGTFVLDLGQSAGNSAPSASLTVSTDTGDNNVSIAHKGGDALTDENTRIMVTNESDGVTLDFDPGSTDESFTVGDEVVIDVAPSTATVSNSDSDVWTARDEADTENFTSGQIRGGLQYTVEIIDTESQRVIFETTVTA